MEPEITFADASELEDIAKFFEAYAAVPAARREKVDRLRPPMAKRLSLSAGGLLQHALESRGVSGADAEIVEGAYGKPFLPRRPDVQFSLSHSGTRVMCVTADRPVGCDIQETAPRDLRVARRFFSEAECSAIFAGETEEARQAMFFRIWTLKESFLKCIGLGLSLPMNAFSVVPETGRITLRQSYDDGRYVFLEPDAGVGYACACCIREH